MTHTTHGKHTKGPWMYSNDDNGNPYGCVHSAETNIALIVHEKDGPLIAAAPELLEALKFGIEELDFGGEPKTPMGYAIRKFQEKAKQAIAKAEDIK